MIIITLTKIMKQKIKNNNIMNKDIRKDTIKI
jgi:hypothetical protein